LGSETKGRFLMRTRIVAVITALFTLVAIPAWAGGQWSKWVDCTQNWWDAGKEVTAKTRGSGVVTAYTPNLVVSQWSANEDVTSRANDPSAQVGNVGGSTTGNWEYGKGYCWY